MVVLSFVNAQGYLQLGWHTPFSQYRCCIRHFGSGKPVESKNQLEILGNRWHGSYAR